MGCLNLNGDRADTPAHFVSVSALVVPFIASHVFSSPLDATVCSRLLGGTCFGLRVPFSATASSPRIAYMQLVAFCSMKQCCMTTLSPPRCMVPRVAIIQGSTMKGDLYTRHTGGRSELFTIDMIYVVCQQVAYRYCRLVRIFWCPFEPEFWPRELPVKLDFVRVLNVLYRGLHNQVQ